MLAELPDDNRLEADVLRARIEEGKRLAAPSDEALAAAWQAFQSTPIDLCADSDSETRKCVENAVRAALSALSAGDQPIVGTLVHKLSGDYQFDDEIVAVIRKKSGEVRYVVEDERGLLLIMNAKQCGIAGEQR